MKNIIKQSEKTALVDIDKYGLPPKFLFLDALKQAKRLSKHFQVDKNVVVLGAIFMDFKLGEATKLGKAKDHAKISADYARNFLKKFNLQKDIVEKVANCAEAHHKQVPFRSKEAEIVANADCYKFLTMKNCLKFLKDLEKRKMLPKERIKFLEKKVDEKRNILSLDICKKELEPQYKKIKKMIRKAKQKL